MELYDEVVEIVKKKVAEIKRVDIDSLTEDSDLKNVIGVKSTEMVAVIAALEDEYDVYVDLMKLNKCDTLGEVAKFVTKLVEG